MPAPGPHGPAPAPSKEYLKCDIPSYRFNHCQTATRTASHRDKSMDDTAGHSLRGQPTNRNPPSLVSADDPLASQAYRDCQISSNTPAIPYQSRRLQSVRQHEPCWGLHDVDNRVEWPAYALLHSSSAYVFPKRCVPMVFPNRHAAPFAWLHRRDGSECGPVC